MRERIRKLLRLAQSPNLHEAEAAAAEAERLMRKHGVSAAELEEPAVPEFLGADMGPPEDESPFLAMLVQARHAVQVLINPAGRLILYGPSLSVGVAAAEWARLRTELRAAWADALEEDALRERERQERRRSAEARRAGFGPARDPLVDLLLMSFDLGDVGRKLSEADREAFYFGVAQALREPPAAPPPPARSEQVPGLVLVRRAAVRPAAPQPPAGRQPAAASPQPAQAGAAEAPPPRPPERKLLDARVVERGLKAGRRRRPGPARDAWSLEWFCQTP